MAVIDLDAARAARREADDTGPVVRFGENEYELPVELPYSALEALRGMGDDRQAAGAVVGFIEAVLGKNIDAWRASDPSMNDAQHFIALLMQEYGVKRPLPSSAS